MITQIEIENFKCFKDRVSFPLGNLTLLTGINGRGKSTLLQSLLLMRQSIEHDENTDKILLNGSCIRLNSFKDVRNRNKAMIFTYHYHYESIFPPFIDKGYFQYHLIADQEDEMILQIPQFTLYAKSRTTDDNILFNIERTFKHMYKNYYLYKDSDLTIHSKLLDLLPDELSSHASLDNYSDLSFLEGELPSKSFIDVLRFDRIHYISADRIGPQDFYLKSTLGKFPNVGARGELTANVLYKKKDELVDNRLCIGENVKNLITQTEAWLSKIFGGAKLEIPSSESIILELLLNTNESEYRFKPANVGFGFHSILPIIVSGLIAKEGEILIVENPEIHLHPRAQSELTKFLAKVSSCGVQVLVESHSDHILNGLQVGVVDKIIGENEISVLYFQSDNEKPVVQIPIQKDGRIEVWPEGFFDQSNKDLEKIFGM
jgi:predicted ATPase